MNSRQDSSTAVASGLAEEVVRTFGQVRLRAFGTSMVPAILPGDLISIQRAGLAEISSGQIVLYSKKDRLFIHRVVRHSVISISGNVNEPCLITRGDRLLQDDPPVTSSELLGRVVFIERGKIQFKPEAQPSGCRSLFARVLRSSDRATYLYLRLAARAQLFTFGGTSCRA
jgi:signal peptidase I